MCAMHSHHILCHSHNLYTFYLIGVLKVNSADFEIE